MRPLKRGDIGMVLGKKDFLGHHYKRDIECTVSHEMPLFFLILVLGPGTHHFQDTLYRRESCKRRLRRTRTAPCGPAWMATQVRPAYRQRYLCFSIACISTWQVHLINLSNMNFVIGMPNRCCILEFRASQYFFQIAPRKTPLPYM